MQNPVAECPGFLLLWRYYLGKIEVFCNEYFDRNVIGGSDLCRAQFDI
jgi:hypothetical protein